MKNICILFLLLISCKDIVVSSKDLLKPVQATDFVGNWKAMDKAEEGVKMEISQDGLNYKVVYTYMAKLPNKDLVPVTFITQFEPNVGDPYRPRLKTIDKINGQFVTFDYIRISNFPDQIKNLSTVGYFQKQ